MGELICDLFMGVTITLEEIKKYFETHKRDWTIYIKKVVGFKQSISSTSRSDLLDAMDDLLETRYGYKLVYNDETILVKIKYVDNCGGGGNCLEESSIVSNIKVPTDVENKFNDKVPVLCSISYMDY